MTFELSMDNLQALAGCLASTQIPAERKASEAQLDSIKGQQNFPLALMRLIEMEEVDMPVRLAAAIYFKNFISHHWTPGPDDANIICPADRAAIKGALVNLALSLPARLQVYVADALGVAAKQDYPEQWDELLPELVSRLQADDFAQTISVLKLCHELFLRYRDKFKTDELLLNLQYSLSRFQEPLLSFFTGVSGLVESNPQNASMLDQLFEALLIMAQIFYSLNCQDIPEYFQDHIVEWMQAFLHWIKYTNPVVVSTDEEEPTKLARLQAQICHNVALYTEVAEDVDEFQEALPAFVEAIWNLLMSTSDKPADDALVSTAIGFLTSVSTTKVHSSLFQEESTLQAICENVIIPNIVFRDQDSEKFEIDPLEYIRRDIEQGDKETRRRAACDLVRGLCKHFLDPVTSIFTNYVGSLLNEYSTAPEKNWKAKDAATFLVTAVTVQSTSERMGTTQVNHLVDITEYFANHILPDLQDSNVNSHPVLKADAVKFVITFSNQLPRDALLAALAAVVPVITAEMFVVHTYAAHAVESILTRKDESGARVVGKADISGLLEALLINLFNLLEQAEDREGQENAYVMKAIMRVCEVADDTVLPYTEVALGKLTALLERACKNPGNPGFTHSLFETMAVFISNTCKTDPSKVSAFEEVLFGPFTHIMQEDVAEFLPYVFQLLAQLLEFRPAPIPEFYLSLLEPLTTAEIWARTGNIPAMVRLLVAYIRIGGSNIIQMGLLEPILGIFRDLVGSTVKDVHGFKLLAGVVQYIDLQSLLPLMDTILKILFSRMMARKTHNFAMGFTSFFSLYVALHGVESLLECISNIPPGASLFQNVLQAVYLDNVCKTVSDLDRKVAGVAMTRMLTCGALAEAPEIWGGIIVQLMRLFEEERHIAPVPTVVSLGTEEKEYDTKFSQLVFARPLVVDPCPDVQEPRAYFAQNLHELSKQYPGKILPMLQQALDDRMLECIFKYFEAAGVPQYLA